MLHIYLPTPFPVLRCIGNTRTARPRAANEAVLGKRDSSWRQAQGKVDVSRSLYWEVLNNNDNRFLVLETSDNFHRWFHHVFLQLQVPLNLVYMRTDFDSF
ncbi:hypothetical protein TorRG33x02_146070 [Trema orientale]|uniref:Uncharacterized protein n=1 Tax=Trema orientale TaxID=63057 RepID=A0A2P5EVT6_TREOI|nr:hypothetical protein TorRG33x02_146070 [Trema orientale]